MRVTTDELTGTIEVVLELTRTVGDLTKVVKDLERRIDLCERRSVDIPYA